MVQAEILLIVTLAVVGAYLLVGVLRGPGRRGPGPGGTRAGLTTPVGGAPDSGVALATPREAALRATPVVVNGAAPAASARPHRNSHRPPDLLPAGPLPAGRLPVDPLPVPDLPIRRSGPDPAPAGRRGVNNSRFARFDRSGRPALMGSPYSATARRCHPDR
jgi:hypothetical protein